MALTLKGKRILKGIRRGYGKKLGTQVFYASQERGTITDTHCPGSKKRSRGRGKGLGRGKGRGPIGRMK